MNGIRDVVVRTAKRSVLLRRFASTWGELLLGDPFLAGGTLAYRSMRLLCRSNIAHDVALRYYARRASRAPFRVMASTAFRMTPPVPKVIGELTEIGFSGLFKLSEEPLREVLDDCSKAEFVAQGRAARRVKIDLDNDEHPCKDSFVYRWTNPHKQSQAVDDLAHDPYLVDIARQYLGNEPMLSHTQIWWSYPFDEGRSVYTQEYGFHYDIDDYKCIRLFLYLNDTDENNGPHVIITNTHQRKDLFEKGHRRLTDEEARRRYGAERIKTILGKQGDGFVSDGFGYHKGANPRRRRCMLTIRYCLTELGIA